MKNNFITILILILFFHFSNNTLTGQIDSLNRQPPTFDLLVGGDFGLRLLSGNEALPEVVDIMNRRNSTEDFRLSARFGFNYYHGIGRRFSLKTGVRFANPGFSVSSVEEFDHEQNIDFIDKSYQNEGFHYQYKYQMFEIPLGIKFIFGKNILNPYLEFGVATNFYRGTVIEKSIYAAQGNELLSKNSVFTSESIGQINFMGFIGVGDSLAITKKIQGFSQMIFRYQLNDLRPESMIEERLMSMGMEIGVRYIIMK